MGTKQAQLLAAAQMNKITALKFFMNWTGKRRVVLLVRKVVDCWTPKMMNSAPETTRRAMIRPLFHAYNVPPKFIPMMSVMSAPTMNTVPRRSYSRIN